MKAEKIIEVAFLVLFVMLFVMVDLIILGLVVLFIMEMTK